MGVVYHDTHSDRNKEKYAEILPNINPLMRQWMLDNLLTYEQAIEMWFYKTNRDEKYYVKKHRKKRVYQY